MLGHLQSFESQIGPSLVDRVATTTVSSTRSAYVLAVLVVRLTPWSCRSPRPPRPTCSQPARGQCLRNAGAQLAVRCNAAGCVLVKHVHSCMFVDVWAGAVKLALLCLRAASAVFEHPGYGCSAYAARGEERAARDRPLLSATSAESSASCGLRPSVLL